MIPSDGSKDHARSICGHNSENIRIYESTSNNKANQVFVLHFRVAWLAINTKYLFEITGETCQFLYVLPEDYSECPINYQTQQAFILQIQKRLINTWLSSR